MLQQRESSHARGSLADALNLCSITILNSARKHAAELLPILGTKGFVDFYVEKLRPGSASIPYPLKGVSFTFAARKDSIMADVILNVPCHGDPTIFNYLSEQFTRTKGVVSVDTSHGLRMVYMTGAFGDANSLAATFNADVELLHEYLLKVGQVREDAEYKLENELRELAREQEKVVAPVLSLAQQLEELGFERAPVSDESTLMIAESFSRALNRATL